MNINEVFLKRGGTPKIIQVMHDHHDHDLVLKLVKPMVMPMDAPI